MEDDNLVVAGAINVVDLKGARLGHYTNTPFKQIKNLVTANQVTMQRVLSKIKNIMIIRQYNSRKILII